MAADDERLQALLDQFAPRTRDIVLQTPIAADIERLEFLLTLTPQNQSDVARRLDMEWTWDDAVRLLPEPSSREGVVGADAPDEPGAHPAESTELANVPKTDVVLGEDARQVAAPETAPGSPDRTSHVVLVRRSELRANSINATIYRESLEDDRLRDLADHLARYGQREPIIVDSSLMILSGERRWRALRLIGADYARVVVDATQRSADELEDLVLDDFSLKRKPSMEEQFNVYDAAVRSYTRRYGRATGRPRKGNKNLSGFWDTNRVRDEAAAAAGLGSRETVRQAKWVLKHGDAKTTAAMLCRDITINAAYVLLQEASGDEADITETKPPPQLPSGLSEQSRVEPRKPSAIEAEPQRATVPTDALVPSGAELPSSGGAPSANPGESPPDVAGRDTGVAEVPTRQTMEADAGSHKPPGQGTPGVNGLLPEQKPTPRTKPKRAKGRDHTPDRRSFDRGLKAAVGYVAALRECDEAEEARSARNEAMAQFDAAAFGQGGADCGEDEAAGEDSVLDEGEEGSEDDPALDDAEEDLTVWPEEDDEDPSTRGEHADGSRVDAESGEADADDEDDGPAKAKDEEFDYSDYYDDDDADENGDPQDDADDDDLAESEEEDYEDEESEEEDELKDPDDVEVDRIIGRSRARRI